MVFEILTPAALGLVGSLARMAVQLMRGAGYPKTWKNFAAELLIGAVAGFSYSLTGLPNHLATLVVGYTGADALEAIFRRFRPEKTTP